MAHQMVVHRWWRRDRESQREEAAGAQRLKLKCSPKWCGACAAKPKSAYLWPLVWGLGSLFSLLVFFRLFLFVFIFIYFFFALGSLAPWGLAFVKMHLWSYFVVVLLLPFLRVWLCVCLGSIFFLYLCSLLLCAQRRRRKISQGVASLSGVSAMASPSCLSLSLYPITHPISERSATKAATFPIHFCRDSTFTDLTKYSPRLFMWNLRTKKENLVW